MLSEKERKYFDSLLEEFNNKYGHVFETKTHDTSYKGTPITESNAKIVKREIDKQFSKIREEVALLQNRTELDNLSSNISDLKSQIEQSNSMRRDDLQLSKDLIKFQDTLKILEEGLIGHTHDVTTKEIEKVISNVKELENKLGNQRILSTLIDSLDDDIKELQKFVKNFSNHKHQYEHTYGEDKIPVATIEKRGLMAPWMVKKLKEKKTKDHPPLWPGLPTSGDPHVHNGLDCYLNINNLVAVFVDGVLTNLIRETSPYIYSDSYKYTDGLSAITYDGYADVPSGTVTGKSLIIIGA